MINVSNQFKEEINAGTTAYEMQLDITLADGTSLSVGNDVLTGISFDDALCSDNTFSALGSASIGQLTFTLLNFNTDYTQYVFEGAVIRAYASLVVGDDVLRTETIQKGVYTVDEAKYTTTSVRITALDNMSKFEFPYDTTLAYPATLQAIVLDACNKCGVALNTTTFPSYTLSMPTKPGADKATYREVISWVASLAGCFARCNYQGRLELKWYDTNALYTAMQSSTQSTDVHYLSRLKTRDISIDPINVTQIAVTVKNSNNASADTTKYKHGTDGYTIELAENNQFITSSNAQQTVDRLYSAFESAKLFQLDLRRATMTHLNNPTIEAGDVAIIVENDTKYPILVTRTTWNPVGIQTSVCAFATASRNAITRQTNSSKAYSAARELVRDEKTSRELAIETLQEALDAKSAMYTTTVIESGNVTAWYLHNQPTLAESNIQWKLTMDAWAVSTDYGQTWNAGVLANGDTITNILNAIGVNAEWIQGALEDDAHKNYWNLSTGEFRMASNVTVGGSTVQNIADMAAGTAVNAQTQTFIFNKLTNDGALQGLYMKDGKLYINAEYIVSGILRDATNSNYWNLDTGEFQLSTMPTINLLPSIYRREYLSPAVTTSDGWTSGGVKWTVDALGRVTGSGTATADNSYFLITANDLTSPVPRITLDPAKSYFLQGGPAGGSQEGYSLRAQAYDASENVINTYADYGDGVVIPAGATYLYVWIRFMSGTSTTKRFWPMLSEGTTRKAYQSTHGAEGQMNASIKVNADGITAEVTNRQNADTSLQSQITQNAGQIALKVNTSDYTASNIVGKINGSSLVIDPDNISLVGKTINLTSENVQIISTSGMNVSKDGSIWTGEMKPNKSYASITPDGVLFSHYWLGRGDTPVGQRVLLSSGVIYLQKGEASGTWTDPTTYTGPYTWTTVSTYGLTPDSTDPYTVVSQTNITNITAGDIATGKLLTTGQARLFNSSGIWRANATPQFWFWRSDSTTQANTLALIFANTQTVNSKACMERFYIREYSYDASTGDQKNNWENYYLPTVNAGRTTNASYQILTTKTVGKNTVTYSATVNFAANETKNITLTGTLPSGYAVTDVAGIIAQNTGDGNVVFVTISQPNTATSMGVTCRNFSNSAANNCTVSVTYRLIKGL